MSIGKVFIIGCLAYTAYQFWPASGGTLSARGAGGASHAAFAALPQPQGHDDRTVYVVAALNCTRDAAKRADALVEELKARGVPVVRTNNVSFPPSIGVTDLPRINAVMGGTLPIVFYGGQAAANPTLDQVLAVTGRGT